MRTIVFSGIGIFAIFVTTEASAEMSPHPGSCAAYRDWCNTNGHPDICDEKYQYAITHNGIWKSKHFDRFRIQWIDTLGTCIL